MRDLSQWNEKAAQLLSGEHSFIYYFKYFLKYLLVTGSVLSPLGIEMEVSKVNET